MPKRSNFDPTSVPGLSAEARQAVNAVFDAMSNWRSETASSNEKNIAHVIEKMAAAARALGWPEQIVEASRAQMQNLTRLQMIDTWEEQIKSPDPSAMMSKLKSMPGFGAAAGWPNADAFSAFNPMQAYMQVFEQWQKAWTNATGFTRRASSS